MITLVSTPAVVVNEYPDAKFTVDTVEEYIGATLRLYGTITGVTNDNIGVYDPVNETMILGTILSTSSGLVNTDIDWDARYTVDLDGTYMINYGVLGQVISRVVGTDCPVEFTFSRDDGTVTTVEEYIGSTLQLNGTLTGVVGDKIGVYDPVNNEMIEGTILNVAVGEVYTDITWAARYTVDLAGTYMINYTLSQGVYLQYRIKANGAYMANTYNAQQDFEGNIVADIRDALSSLVNDTKVGDYTADCVAETNQSGYFTLEYRERYQGDTNTWEEEGNTWYYIRATRTLEQGCNLVEYFSADGIDGEFLCEFNVAKWNIGTPMDVGFWWSPDALTATATIEELDLANNILDTHTVVCPTAGIGYLNSLRVNRTELTTNTRKLAISMAFTWS